MSDRDPFYEPNRSRRNRLRWLAIYLKLSRLAWRIALFLVILIPSLNCWMWWYPHPEKRGIPSSPSVAQTEHDVPSTASNSHISSNSHKRILDLKDEASLKKHSSLEETDPAPLQPGTQRNEPDSPVDAAEAVRKAASNCELPLAQQQTIAGNDRSETKSISKPAEGTFKAKAPSQSDAAPTTSLLTQISSTLAVCRNAALDFGGLLHDQWWPWLWLPVELFLLWVTARAFLYDRFGTTALNTLIDLPQRIIDCESRIQREPTGTTSSGGRSKTATESLDEEIESRLLHSQQQAYHQIVRLTEARRLDDPPEVVAISGDWGTGKSYVLEAITFRFHQLTRWHVLGDNQGRNGRRESGQQSGNRAPPVPQAILVSMNVWAEATEREFHLALYEGLLGHPNAPHCPRLPHCYLQELLRFLSYPLKLLPAYLLRYCGNVFAGGKVPMPGGSTVALTLSDMFWRRDLDERITELRQAGYRIIWALDDLDRTSPEMAQAALSVIRRFLNHPGTIILLPFVQSQIRYKVFNPLIQTRSDIEATMFAVIQEHASLRLGGNDPIPQNQQGLGRYLGATINHPFDSPSTSSSGNTPRTGNIIAETTSTSTTASNASGASACGAGAFSLPKWFPSNFGQSLTPEAVAVLLAAEPASTFARYLKASLVEYYLHHLTPQQRDKLAFLFEEKYLHQLSVNIRPISPEDIPSIPLLFGEIRPWAQRCLQFAGASAENTSALNEEGPSTNAGQDFLKKLWKATKFSIHELNKTDEKQGRTVRPHLRHFIDDLHDKLLKLDDVYTRELGNRPVSVLLMAYPLLDERQQAMLLLDPSQKANDRDNDEDRELLKSIERILDEVALVVDAPTAVKVYLMFVLTAYRQVTRYPIVPE